MKLVTIICNIVLLGFTCLLLLFEGISREPACLVFTLLLSLVPILNILFMFGSRMNSVVAVISNIALSGFACWAFVTLYPHPIESLVFVYALLVILTPILSLITILISGTNKYKDIKRTFIFTVIGLAALLFCFILAVRIWIGSEIKERINVAKKEYSGIAEDALIAYLSDTTHAPRDRSDVAIWTLGQIRSRKALPVLKELYKNDPEGKTCKYHHDTVLCQYEIHKAIVSIEHKWLGAKEKNWSGSWSRLNK